MNLNRLLMRTRCLYILFIAIFITPTGCSSIKKSSSVIDKIIKTPSVYIETLKHPNEFPEEYLPEVLDIDEISKQNPLGEGEIVKILLLSETKMTSTHFLEVREDGEIKPHFHKKHDKAISVKKGEGIAILNGTRYLVKPGTIIQVPSNTEYKFINTGKVPFVALSVFTPPFNGDDITYVKEEIESKPVSEAQKEKDKIEKKDTEGSAQRNNNEKDIYNARNVTKTDDKNKEFNAPNTSHDLLDTTSNKQDTENDKVSEKSAAHSNTVDRPHTFDNDQGLEYDLDKRIDGKEPLNRNASDKKFTKDDMETLSDESEFDSNSEQFIFDEFEETKQGEFVYEAENDSTGSINKKEGAEAFEYEEDEPSHNTDAPLIRENFDKSED